MPSFSVLGVSVILQKPKPHQVYMKYLPVFSSSTFMVSFFKYTAS